MNDEMVRGENFRCGMVSIVGRPNVGKSTLLNALVKEKVAIVSNVPQTTRNRIRGIYTDERCQMIFIDTPGVHASRDKLDRLMNQSAVGTIEDADCLIHLVDVNEPVGKDEEGIVQRLSKLKRPVVLGLNKVDAGDRFIPEYIDLWERVTGQPLQTLKPFAMIPLSAMTGIHLEKLIDIFYEYLPPGPALYPEDTVTDTPQRMVIADIVREKLLAIMRDEVPHALGVIVEDIQRKRPNTLHIRVLILVERDTQKEIVIGRKGNILKEVGTLARTELEDLLEAKIFLELFVKSRRNWRDNLSLLDEMGYKNF